MSLGMQGAFLGGVKSSKGTPKLGCCGVAPTQGQMVLSMGGEACSPFKVDILQGVRQARGLGLAATEDLCIITNSSELPLVQQTVV